MEDFMKIIKTKKRKIREFGIHVASSTRSSR